jgi:ATP synthase protein I
LNDDEEKRQRVRLIAAYVTIPFVLAVPPVIGWLIGSWLDKYLDTKPYIMYTLILFGFIAGFRELYRIVKKFGKEF